MYVRLARSEEGLSSGSISVVFAGQCRRGGSSRGGGLDGSLDRRTDLWGNGGDIHLHKFFQVLKTLQECIDLFLSVFLYGQRIGTGLFQSLEAGIFGVRNVRLCGIHG